MNLSKLNWLLFSIVASVYIAHSSAAYRDEPTFIMKTSERGECSPRISCVIYENCCDPVVVDHTNQSKGDHSAIFSNMKKRPYKNRFSCVALPQFTHDVHFPYQMIDWCPDDANTSNTVKSKCERSTVIEERDWLLDLPVESNDTGIVYANSYCSECHGDTNLKILKLFLSGKTYRTNKNNSMPIEVDFKEKVVYHWYDGKIRASDAYSFFGEFLLPFKPLFGHSIFFLNFEWTQCSKDYMKINLCNDIDHKFLYEYLCKTNSHGLYVNPYNIIRHKYNSICLNETLEPKDCVIYNDYPSSRSDRVVPIIDDIQFAVDNNHIKEIP